MFIIVFLICCLLFVFWTMLKMASIEDSKLEELKASDFEV